MQRHQRIVTGVQPDLIPPTILADPDDDHVLACALSLQAHQGIPILAAAGAIQYVESSQHPGTK